MKIALIILSLLPRTDSHVVLEDVDGTKIHIVGENAGDWVHDMFPIDAEQVEQQYQEWEDEFSEEPEPIEKQVWEV